MNRQLIMPLVALILFTGYFAPMAQAAIPGEVGYYGILRNQAGTIVTDGSYSIRFALYTTATGGTAAWQETKSVSVRNGLFSTKLGSVTTLSPSLFTQSLYLGVKVGTDSEMLPRTELSSSPFAINASQLEGKTVGTGANQILALNSSQDLNLPGNISTPGGLTVANGLTVSGGSLSLPTNSIQGFSLIDNTVTGAKITAAAIGSRELANSITLDADMTFTLDGNDFVVNDAGSGGVFDVDLAGVPMFTVNPATNSISIYDSEITSETFTLGSNLIENSAEFTTEGLDFIIDLEDAGDFGLFELTSDNITVNDEGRLAIDGAFSTGYGEWNSLGQILLTGGSAGLDRTNAGGALLIGNFFATSLTVGRSGVTTTFPGQILLGLNGLDASGATALNIGTGAATGITVSRTDVQTMVQGRFRVNQTSDFQDDILAREDVTIDGGLSVGNSFGTTIDRYGEHTNVIDFPDTVTGSCSVSGPLVWAGAQVGESVLVGSSVVLTSGSFLTAHITAVDAGVIQFCNLSGGNIDPASATYTTRFIQ